VSGFQIQGLGGFSEILYFDWGVLGGVIHCPMHTVIWWYSRF